MSRNDDGTTRKLRMLINIMLAAMAQLPALTVSIVSRISDARAYWRIGGSAYWLISRHAARAQANKQSSMPSRLHRHVDRDHDAGDRRRGGAVDLTATPVGAGSAADTTMLPRASVIRAFLPERTKVRSLSIDRLGRVTGDFLAPKPSSLPHVVRTFMARHRPRSEDMDEPTSAFGRRFGSVGGIKLRLEMAVDNRRVPFGRWPVGSSDFFGSGSSIERRGFFIVIPSANCRDYFL